MYKKLNLKFKDLLPKKKKFFFSQKPNKIPTKKNSPKDKKKFQKPCKILTKKKMDDDEKKETLKTLIRYIIGDTNMLLFKF